MRLVGDYHEPQVPCHAPAEAEARKTVMPTRPELRGEVESPLSAGQVLAVKLSLSLLGVTSSVGYSEIKRQKGHSP